MLNWLLHKRELLTTNDSQVYHNTLDRLSEHSIPYRTKWKSTLAGRSRGTGFGQNPANSVQYYIYVQKQDLDKARYAIR